MTGDKKEVNKMKKLLTIVLLGVLLTSGLAQELENETLPADTATNETITPETTGGTETTTNDTGVTPETTDNYGTSPPTTPDTTGEDEVLPSSETVSAEETATAETIAEEVPTDLITIEAETELTEPAEPVEINSTTTAEQVIEEVQGEVVDPEIVIEDQVPQTEQLSCEVGRYTYATELAVIRMNAVMNYIETELGLDTAELEAIKNDLYSTIADAGSATTKDQYEQILEKSKGLVSDFREKARALEGFDQTKAQEYIDKALADNKDYLSGIEAERNKACATTVLTRFDVFIENTAKVLKEMEEAGTDPQIIANLKYKLDLLIKMRADLQSALDSGDRTKFLAVEQAFKDLMRELKLKGNIVRVIARNLFGQQVSRLAIYRNIVKQAEARLDKLAQSGVDTTGLQAKLDEVKAKLDDAEAALRDAKQKWSEKDYSGAKEAGEKAIALLDEARNIYSTLQLDAGRGLLKSVCKDLPGIIAKAETAIQAAESEISVLDNETAQEPVANINRLKEFVDKAKNLKDSGKLDNACELLQKAQNLHTKLKDDVKDYKRIKAGERLVSDDQLESGAAAAIKAAIQRPQIVKDFCERNPAKCAQVLKNNTALARVVRERAADVVQTVVESGEVNASAVGPIRTKIKEAIRQEVQERIKEKLKNIRGQGNKGTQVGSSEETE